MECNVFNFAYKYHTHLKRSLSVSKHKIVCFWFKQNSSITFILTLQISIIDYFWNNSSFIVTIIFNPVSAYETRVTRFWCLILFSLNTCIDFSRNRKPMKNVLTLEIKENFFFFWQHCDFMAWGLWEIRKGKQEISLNNEHGFCYFKENAVACSCKIN